MGKHREENNLKMQAEIKVMQATSQRTPGASEARRSKV
jgi:hypothetical protein